MASRAYAEQLGWKRQAPPKWGLRTTVYPSISLIRSHRQAAEKATQAVLEISPILRFIPKYD